MITRFELLSGAETARQLARVHQLLDAIPSLDLDDTVADASEVRRSLERSGTTLGMAESLIAGIVLSAGGDLVTRNRRHIECVPGLKLS